MKLWQAIDQLAADYFECVVTSIHARLDMIMVILEYQRLITTFKQTMELGDVPVSRIDDLPLWRHGLQLGCGAQRNQESQILFSGIIPRSVSCITNGRARHFNYITNLSKWEQVTLPPCFLLAMT